MNRYFLTLVIKPGLDEKSRKELLANIKEILGGGKVLKEDLWGERDLAYPIKKQSKAYYVHLELELEPNIAKGLDKTLKVEEDIIRHLFVRTK